MPLAAVYDGCASGIGKSAAVDQLLVDRPDIELSLHVVSAGYGLLASGDPVVPYEATLGSARRQWIERGRQLELPDRMKDLITSVDAAIIALGVSNARIRLGAHKT